MRMDEHTHGTLRFWREATATHDIKFAAGKLQVPGAVDRQRDVVAQRAVSKGRGDDAGHLIAHQFGGPEAPYNLSIQNYRQNQGGGTYWDLEQRWASELKNGVEVDVTVREMSRKGEDRPYHRHVSWLETHKDSLVLGELDFVNTMSPKGRVAEGIPKVEFATPAKVVDLPRAGPRVSGGNNGNQRPKQHVFHDREHGGRGPDSQREHQYRCGCETRRLQQMTKRNSQFIESHMWGP